MVKKHLKLLKKYCGEKYAVLNIRIHIPKYFKGFDSCKEIINKFYTTYSYKELIKYIDTIKC
jgi:tRNA-dihydrouridine synthase